jgi:hypothetical protein
MYPTFFAGEYKLFAQDNKCGSWLSVEHMTLKFLLVFSVVHKPCNIVWEGKARALMNITFYRNCQNEDTEQF